MTQDVSATPANRTLMLVDDEPHILSALRRALRPDGYNLLACEDAREALAVLARQPVDVILSDHRMPNMNGVEFLRQARDAYPDTVRIVLSGYADLQFITDAINEGAIYKFLTKPWDDEQLRAHIREAFHRKEISDENRRLTQALRDANLDLQALLAEKASQARQIETVLNTLQEVLQLIPWPLVGLDEEGLIALANEAADQLLDENGLPLLGRDAHTALPQVLSPWLDGQAQRPAYIECHGSEYRVLCKTLGHHSRARGALLALLPRETKP